MSRMSSRTGRRRWLQAGLVWATAAVTGCAVPGPTLRERLPADLPPAVELDGTPFFPQTAYHCGPAALATALGAVGVSVLPQDLADQVFLPARQGSLQIEMIAAARRAARVATRVPGGLGLLLQELAAGHVVVLLQNLGFDAAPVWHYAVAIGYSLERGEVVLRSGTMRRQTLGFAVFEQTWARAGDWGFVVLPAGQWPVTATRQAVIDAAIGYERNAPPALALRAYASASQRWPDDLALTMGLGNTAHAVGQKVLAADSFGRAARAHRSTPAWLNLGRTLLDAGLPDSAWRVALEAEYLAEPAWRTETTALLRELYPLRSARAVPSRAAAMGTADEPDQTKPSSARR